MTRAPSSESAAHDQRVELCGLTFDDYERLLAIRGERAVPRLTFLDGVLELMSPSLDHEAIARALCRLVECYAEERDVALNAYGHWTVRHPGSRRGVEPDGCYVLGAGRPERPDLAIQVAWTHSAAWKLAVYRGLSVPEVWIWQADRIMVHVLSDDGYAEGVQSALLPGLDLARVAALVREPDQTAAVRRFRMELAAR